MTSLHTHRILDATGVDAVLDAAEKHALQHGRRVVIAVVERSGELVGLRRTPGAQVASSRVAVDKARTAAIFIRPTRELEQQVSSGRLGALALHGAKALTGGIPLRVGDEVVGAIGASGETPDEDEAVALAGATAPFSTTTVPALSAAEARTVAATVASECSRRHVSPVCAVVDAGGDLICIWRPDDAQVASVDVATDKARTAAIYRRPSKDFEDQASNGRASALHLARAVPLQGGVPILRDGHVIGAVGVSGASSADEDQELAAMGADTTLAGNGSANGAAFFDGQTVMRRFATGGLLLDAGAYKLDAGRREAPGEVEYHAHTVDVMHVVQGTATVLTGGQMEGVRGAGDGELRADSVSGGQPHELAAGDVLVIPAGVPHQFTRTSEPFLYFVVKVEV
jgi:glc operon protein GlcG